ncbi:MAG: aldo/keto reductase [Candidatus Thorarchaeota archaeon]|nr:aldo/keto reductase [Candidatus Thorarchaeota archaeon]
MKYAKLGQTGLKVSRLILGTMQMGWLVDEETSHKLLDVALEAGLNTIDTADIYSKWAEESYSGKSEEIIGRWLINQDRDEIVLATKVRGEMSSNPNDVGLSRKHILESITRSLDRLNTDYVDLYQSHSFDPDAPQEETLRAYTSLVDAGVVHYVGASNFTAAELVESLWTSDKHGLVRYESLQPPYSLARRRDYEKYLQPVIEMHSLGVISYSPLGGGFLTGRYAEDAAPDSKRAATTKTRYYKERNFRIVDVLIEIAANKEATVAQIALAWILTRDTITAPIIGVNSIEQLEENLASLELKLSEDDIAWLNESSDWTEVDQLAR